MRQNPRGLNEQAADASALASMARSMVAESSASLGTKVVSVHGIHSPRQNHQEETGYCPSLPQPSISRVFVARILGKPKLQHAVDCLPEQCNIII